MVLLLQYTLIFASVLILVALGGCFSEHSGVINLGLEGVMIMGALGGALAMRYMPTGSSAFSMLIVVLLWIVESRPSWLYAFVVSIGLGFSGYSLIELFGEQVKSFVTDVFDKARSTIGQTPAKGDDR